MDVPAHVCWLVPQQRSDAVIHVEGQQGPGRSPPQKENYPSIQLTVRQALPVTLHSTATHSWVPR